MFLKTLHSPLKSPDIEALMWVSIERFGELMEWPIDKVIEACISESLVVEKITDKRGVDCRISIKNLSISALKKHLTTVIDSAAQWKNELLKAQKHLNALAYASMKDFEKNSVDKWLPILLETGCLRGKALKEYLKGKDIPYNTFWRHQNKWILSGGDINSLRPNYSHHKYMRKTEGR